MKLISWNIAGINACSRKGLLQFIQQQNADFYCFQEVKSSPDCLNWLKYKVYWHPAEKKGYSGVVTLSKTTPLRVIKGIGNKTIDKEGRVLTLEFKDFFLINAYFPHAHRKLLRLDFKLTFNQLFHEFCQTLNKPIIIAADFNVAHKEIDLKNPKQNKNNAGFTPKERAWFDQFLVSGYIDTFREFTTIGDHYTWWTYRNNARQRNIGWRIDYFLISNTLRNQLKSSTIFNETLGSDHCPIAVELSQPLYTSPLFSTS